MLVRKKLSKSGWIILALIAIALIVAPVLHFTGVFDLSFLGDLAISAAATGATSGWMAAILAGICGGIGFGACFILKDYIIGIEDKNSNLIVSNSGNTGSYNPLPTQPSQVGVS